jgi:hypothetical protein
MNKSEWMPDNPFTEEPRSDVDKALAVGFAAGVIACKEKLVTMIEREFLVELEDAKECTNVYCKEHIGKKNDCRTGCIFYRWHQVKEELTVK